MKKKEETRKTMTIAIDELKLEIWGFFEYGDFLPFLHYNIFFKWFVGPTVHNNKKWDPPTSHVNKKCNKLLKKRQRQHLLMPFCDLVPSY